MKRSQALATLDDPREARFVEIYCETSNAKQSAIAAGYPVRSAHTLGSRLLKKVYVREAIEKRNAEFMARYDFTPGRIIRELAKLAGSNIDDYVALQDDGTLSIDFSTATRDQMAAISALEEDVGEFGRRNKFKLHDKKSALIELAKIANMYPAQKLEHTGADGGPIASVNLNVSKIDVEALEPEQRAQLRQTLLMLKQARDNSASDA